jgi:protein SCO1/2
MPAATLIDDRGQVVRLDSLRGKVLTVSFFSSSTAAAGSCTAIAGKFLYLQRHLPSNDYRLLQITRDPAHDSPQRLRAYASEYGAESSVWSFLTGDKKQIAALIRGLNATAPQGPQENEPLYVIDAQGYVAGMLPGGDWSPVDALELALSLQGRGGRP